MQHTSQYLARSKRSIDYQLAIIAAVIVACAAIGLSIQRPLWLGGFALFSFAAIWLLIVRNWWLGILGLTLYVPFSGFATVLLYPRTGEASLVKDLLFIAPAYLGFLLTRPSTTKMSFPWTAFLPYLAIIVLASFNPLNPSSFTAVVGLKIALWYLPLYFLGYQIAQQDSRLSRFLRVASLSSVIPAVAGLTQALLIQSGHSDAAYALYGAAKAAMTQDSTQFFIPGTSARLVRIPSTFPFVTQYYLYLNIMTVIVYAWWRTCFRSDRMARNFGLPILAVLVLATLLCGARGAFIFTPLLIAMLALTDRGRGVNIRILPLLIFGSISYALVAAVTSASPTALFQYAWEIGRIQVADVLFDGFKRVGTDHWLGIGTGTGAIASRSLTSAFDTTRWEESWYVKTYLELGVLGVAAAIVFLGAIVASTWKALRSASSSPWRPLVAAVLVLQLWVLGYAIKGSHLDLDPMNLYFWLLSGIAVGVANRNPKQQSCADSSRVRTSPP